MKIKTLKISELKPYEQNARTHPKAQVELLKKNIERFGFTTPILIDKDNEIIAGYGRLEAVKELNWTEVSCVRMENLSKDEVRALRIADNKLTEMAEWDMNILTAELKELSDEDFDMTGFDKDLLIEPDEKDDEVSEIPEEPKSKLGDLYELGNHRVLCGDSTKMEDIEKLVHGDIADMCFTDPPYNINYTGGMGIHGKNEREGIQNDKMSKPDFRQFMKDALDPIIKNTNGGIYVCMASSELDSLKETFEESGGYWQSFIIWVKNNFTLSRADYQNTYEPILYGWRKGVTNHYFAQNRDIANVWEDLREVKTEYDGKSTTISFQGFKVKIEGKVDKGEVIRKKQSTDIWRYNKPTKSIEHSTMKPVELITEAIKYSSKRGEIVLDPFLGSGSTLITAEKTGRKCYGMELDPKYVDVIVQRYVDYIDNPVVKCNGKNVTHLWQKTKGKTEVGIT